MLFSDKLRAGVGVLGILATGTVHADFLVVENFENGTVGSSVSTLGWSGTTNGLPYATVAEYPVAGENQVLQLTGTTQNNGVYLNLSASQLIASGATGTLFFRVLFSSDENYNVNIGFGNTDDPYNSVQGNFRFRAADAETWTVSHGTNPAVNATSPATRDVDVWYSVWVVVNPEGGANKWEAYVQAEGGSQTQVVTGASNALFTFKDGNGVDAATDRLVIYFGTTSGVALGGASPVFLDDIYIDPAGKNLASPIPEASTWLWMVCGGLAAGWIARRREGVRR